MKKGLYINNKQNKFKNINEKIILFKQDMFYYKFNLWLPNLIWTGTKACKKKNLVNPQWLRNIKDRKYSFFRIDTFFSKTKYNSIKIINNGGWHFSNIKTPKEIEFKLRSYLHHREFDVNPLSVDQINEIIKNKQAIYDLKVDKTNNKIGNGNFLKKFELNKHLKSQMGGFKSSSFKKLSRSFSQQISQGQSSSFMENTLFPSIDKINIITWEHTHPLLYVKSENKIYALDALDHKTFLNSNNINDDHNVEIKIEALPVKNRIGEYNYSLWYNNLQDKDSRIYVENPTPFSKNTPFIMPVKKNVGEGMIFGSKFSRKKLESSQYYNPLLRVLDLRSLNSSAILTDAINELCLIEKEDSFSSKRTSSQSRKKFV